MWLSDMSVRRPLVAVVISALLTVSCLLIFLLDTLKQLQNISSSLYHRRLSCIS